MFTSPDVKCDAVDRVKYYTSPVEISVATEMPFRAKKTCDYVFDDNLN